MKLTEKIIDLIESKTSCGVGEWSKGYSIYVDNTCGEDYTIEINKGDNEVEEIINACDCYDSDEHFKLWYGVGKGEPSDARTLLDNCDEIGKNLEELADLLRSL